MRKILLPLLGLWTFSLIVWTGLVVRNEFKDQARKHLAHEKLATLVHPPELQAATSRNIQAMELLQQAKELSAFIGSQPAPEDADKATSLLQKVNRQATMTIQQPQLGLVFNGHDAEPGQLPYQVGIVLSLYVPYAGRGYRCGGALINSTWVITAAHCFSDETQPEDVQVFVGPVKLSETSKPNCNCWYSVKTLVRFPQYQLRATNYGQVPIGDVALLELAKPASGSDVKPVTVAKSSSALSLIRPALATISGWGKSSPDAKYLTDQLQYGTMRIIDDAKCTKVYGANIIQGNMICAKPELADICTGDSGGPLVVQDAAASATTKPQYTLGVVSWKYPLGGCSPAMPGVFSRLTEAAISDWVQACITGSSCPSSFP